MDNFVVTPQTPPLEPIASPASLPLPPTVVRLPSAPAAVLRRVLAGRLPHPMRVPMAAVAHAQSIRRVVRAVPVRLQTLPVRFQALPASSVVQR
ncbi:hypothetical protein ACQEVZ_40000 [Dactylosporangium sp. CA-152071]|uniref:hypothetical protein n=1 Tax=Dactylosporangium sp. CA-152071 TaxID=3239933 RepID=UPI003D8F1A22